ncbi:uncharacterized protein LOC144179660 isoform X2 [Haemaphysalis longicornis]
MDSSPPCCLAMLLLLLLVAFGASADKATEREPASFRQQLPLGSYPSLYGLAYQQGFPAAYLPRPAVTRPSLGTRLRGLVNALFFRRQPSGYQSFKPTAALKPDLIAAASKPLLQSAHKIHFPGSFQADKLGYAKQGLQPYAQTYPYLSTAKLYNGIYAPSKGSYGAKPFTGNYKA